MRAIVFDLLAVVFYCVAMIFALILLVVTGDIFCFVPMISCGTMSVWHSVGAEHRVRNQT